mgnify:CR=1 FL=1
MKDTTPKKFIREYKSDDGKRVVARWHYDYSINKYGPILTEDLEDLPTEKPKRQKKKVDPS